MAARATGGLSDDIITSVERDDAGRLVVVQWSKSWADREYRRELSKRVYARIDAPRAYEPRQSKPHNPHPAHDCDCRMCRDRPFAEKFFDEYLADMNLTDKETGWNERLSVGKEDFRVVAGIRRKGVADHNEGELRQHILERNTPACIIREGRRFHARNSGWRGCYGDSVENVFEKFGWCCAVYVAGNYSHSVWPQG